MIQIGPDRVVPNPEMEEPEHFCRHHGVKLIVTRHSIYNVLTGEKQTSHFISKCPRWFCGFQILTGVIRPQPEVVTAHQEDASTKDE